MASPKAKTPPSALAKQVPVAVGGGDAREDGRVERLGHAPGSQVDAAEADHPRVVVDVGRLAAPAGRAGAVIATPTASDHRDEDRRHGHRHQRRDERRPARRRRGPRRDTPRASASAHGVDCARAVPRRGAEAVTKSLRRRLNAGVGRHRRSGLYPTLGAPHRGADPFGRSRQPHGRMGRMSPDSPTAEHPDTFGARADLAVGDRTYEIFHITAPALTERYDIARLPYSIKVLLENLLRHEDGAARLGRRHRRRGGLGRQSRGSRPGRRRRRPRDRLHPRAGAHAGLHRRARRRRPGRHARRAGPPGGRRRRRSTRSSRSSW